MRGGGGSSTETFHLSWTESKPATREAWAIAGGSYWPFSTLTGTIKMTDQFYLGPRQSCSVMLNNGSKCC